jgi:hypothetical protein
MRFSKSPYDRAHYQTVRGVAVKLSALAAQEPPDQFEPTRAPVLSRPTPFVAGDAAFADGDGSSFSSGAPTTGCGPCRAALWKWGETPTAGVECEAYEETGVLWQAVRLIVVFD